MKNLFILIVLLFTFTVSGQSQERTFEYNGKEVKYYRINGTYREAFNVVFTEVLDLEPSKVFAKSRQTSFWVRIPSDTKDKENFCLRFLCEIMSKTKLVDREFNLIAEQDYFSTYRKSGKKTKGMDCYLTPIHEATFTVDVSEMIHKIR